MNFKTIVHLLLAFGAAYTDQYWAETDTSTQLGLSLFIVIGWWLMS